MKSRNCPLCITPYSHLPHLYAILIASISTSRDRGGVEFAFRDTTVENKIPYTMNVAEDFQQTFDRITPNDNSVFLLLWHVLHLILGVLYFAQEVFQTVENYLITNGIVKAYEHVNLQRVYYLGVVIDSDEAHETTEVIELLEWLSDIGIQKVCLYDKEGVLKKSKEVFVEKFNSAKPSNDDSKKDSLLNKKQIDFEFVSISDGKEAVARAANVLFKKYYLDGDTEKPFFTESYLTDALKTVGAVEPDPDLLLVYAPARCHLGFPAWRIRYTEIVHMGPLKHKKYGLILKAIHNFTKVKQNYGS